jgi:molybdopterin converting factor subunit 1
MQVTVRYFAGHRDITGCAAEQIDLSPGATVGALWELLVGRYPRLGGYSGRLLYAVNQEFGTLGTELHGGDEVAFIPPVSGGSNEELGIEKVKRLRPAQLLCFQFSILHFQFYDPVFSDH